MNRFEVVPVSQEVVGNSTGQRPAGSTFERISIQPDPLQPAVDRCNMLVLCAVAGRTQSDLVIGDVEMVCSTGLQQRQHLYRLDRRARKDRPSTISCGYQRPIGANNHRIHEVFTLHYTPCDPHNHRC